MDVSTGDRIGLISLTGITHVTVTAVDNARRTVDFRADDGFEHWASFDQIF
jgi:hypothetical protein